MNMSQKHGVPCATSGQGHAENAFKLSDTDIRGVHQIPILAYMDRSDDVDAF